MINLKNIFWTFSFGFFVSTISVILKSILSSMQVKSYSTYLLTHFPLNAHEQDVFDNIPYNQQIQTTILNVAIFAIIELGGLFLIYKLFSDKDKFNSNLKSDIKFFIVTCLTIFIAMSIVPILYYLFIYNSFYPQAPNYYGIKSIPYWINYVYSSRTLLDAPFRIFVIIKVCIGYFKEAIIDTIILFVILYFFSDRYNLHLNSEEDSESQILYPSPSK